MKMRAVGYLAVSAILFSGIVNAEDNNTGNDEDMYYWNAMAHPYQEYYLEDYCGPVNGTECDSAKHTVYASSAGSSSGLVINGFRDSRPDFKNSSVCCITVKAVDLSRFNVQLDEVLLRQSDTPSAICDNYVRINSLQEELDLICEKVESVSFRTNGNELGVEYVINTNDVPQYQRIKLVVTATEDAATLEGGQCNATREQWMCDNGACIWEGFRCDGHNNCADLSDEFHCGFFWRYWPWMAALLGALGLIVLCSCCCCCCRKSAKSANLYSKMPSGSGQPVRNDFQFVPTLAPTGPPVIGKVYPNLDTAYQRQNNQFPGFSPTVNPPRYSENTRVNPAQRSEYGAIKN